MSLPERMVRTPRALPWVVLSAWVVAAVAARHVRPGELVEFALVGVAGLCAWQLLADERDRALRLAGALLFFVPLLNTWPARALYALVDDLGTVSLLLSPSSVLGMLIVGALVRSRPPALTPPVVAASAVAAVAVLVSTIVSRDRPGAAAAAWLALLLPVALAVTVAGSARSTRDRLTLLAPALVACVVPAAMGVTAFVISFGVPLSLDDLAGAKALLYRTGIVQEVTFGNVAHLASFGLLAAPAAVALSLSHAVPPATRAGAGAAAALLVAATVMVHSRAAMLVWAIMLALAAALALARSLRGNRAEGLAAAVLLLAGALAAGALGVSSLSPSDSAPTTGGVAVEPPTSPEASGSIEFRRKALREGIEIFEDHPLGVGAGQYAEYDPVHTAPHSLLVELLVELGPLGALLPVSLVAMLGLALVRLARSGLPHDEWLLRAGCALGALGFLVFGLLAGVPLAIGAVAVWSLLLAAQIGILFSRSELAG